MGNKVSRSAKTILMEYLEELEEKELKKFTFLLKDYKVEKGYKQIPGGRLEKADCFAITDQMINHYRNEYTLEIAGNLLCQIPRLDLYDKFKCDLQEHMDKNPKLQKTRVKHLKKIYMRCMKEKFRTFEDKNCRIGENIRFKKRYTKLVIVKEYRLQAEREHEIMSSGQKHLELMAQQAEHSYSSIADLFDLEEDGHVPRTIVLQGAAGIGKTMTARKIMLDWASGKLFQGRFDYVFYINCREINQCSGQQTIAELLSHSCPGISLPMSEIEAEPEKVLFVIDGFDELNSSIGFMTGDPSRETQNDNKIMSLIGKQFIVQPYILITTRPTALEKLQKCVVTPRFAEILGFSEDDRKEYFIKFFKDETQGAQAFNIVKGNDLLFTMCFVPIVCWIVSTVIKQQMEKKEDPLYALRTTTSVYMSFLSNLLMKQSSDSVQAIHINLKRLCALARDGVWQQKVLFREEDIVQHALEIPAVQSLFLKNDIFQKDTECENCYSFIHLSFQEFFAAMFYVLRENKETAEHMENPPGAVISLLEASREHKHLMLTVCFLFGLLNKETQNQMEERFKWKIKRDIKPALLQWIKEKMKQDFRRINNEQMELFRCLYEIHDEEFVKGGTEHLKQIGVFQDSLKREMTAMDFRALGFCLENSPGVERVDIWNIEMKQEDLTALMSGLITCSSLRMQRCSLPALCCADLASFLSTNSSLTELCLSQNKLRHSGVRELCAGLRHPSCRIQILGLERCSLTASCCADLASVLRTNSSLTELHLGDNKLMDSGVRKLCVGLKHPGCRIETLVLWSCSLTASCCADLSSVLSTNSSLTELNLSDNKLRDSGVIALCAGMKHPDCRIQTLGLGGCSLTASCCTDLASVLSTNSSLRNLDLGYNKLMDSGVRALCAGLRHPGCRIRTLGLMESGLTDSCTEDLCSALRTNQTLGHLDLTWNPFIWRSEAAFREFQRTGRVRGLGLD